MRKERSVSGLVVLMMLMELNSGGRLDVDVLGKTRVYTTTGEVTISFPCSPASKRLVLTSHFILTTNTLVQFFFQQTSPFSLRAFNSLISSLRVRAP
jgi:hypothetical protein